MSTETYRLAGIDGAPDIEFDRRLHLPPDVASESLARYDGSLAAHAWQTTNAHDPDLHYRVLVPGAGVGTMAHAFAIYERRYRMLGSRTVEIDGFDLDSSAVDFARRNFGAIQDPRFVARFYQADWNNQATWDALRPDSYHLVLFNPPYFPHEELGRVAEDYKEVPAFTLDGGVDGLDHYRTVLPQLPGLIDRRHGGTVLFRFQRTDRDYTNRLRRIMEDAFGEHGRAWPSGIFPTEGRASVKPDATGRKRCVSIGRVVISAEG
jgi:methylase of polypeptide subunit release factors